jgi:hypothetical protein
MSDPVPPCPPAAGRPRPLDYAADAPPPGMQVGTWVILVIVWLLGLASWAVWLYMFFYAIVRLLR